MRRARGTGSVKHLGGDRYLVRIRTAAGRRTGRTIRAESAEAAAAQLDALLRVLDASGQASPGGVTVRGWLSEWLERQRGGRSHGTYDQRIRCYLHTAPWIDDLLANLRPRDVRDHVRALCADYEPSTVQGALAVLRSALREAVEDELIETSPAAEVRLPKSERRRVRSIRAPLSREHLPLLFGSKLPVAEKAIIGVGIHGGLRAGELFAMPLAGVETRDGLLVLRVEFGGYDRAPTKSGKPRLVPITGDARVWLERWLQMVPRSRARNPELLLFPGRDGGRRDYGHASEWLRVRLRRCGIKASPRFHDLRHTAGEALENGWFGAPVQREHVQAIYGHADLKQTAHYTGGASAAMLDAMRKLDAAARGDRDQVGISAADAERKSSAKQAKSEPTARRTPCSSGKPVVSGTSDGSDPEPIPESLDAREAIRAATAELIAGGGSMTVDDVDRWQAVVLAADPTPFRAVRELPSGRFRIRAALSAAHAVLAWLDEQAPVRARKDGGR